MAVDRAAKLEEMRFRRNYWAEQVAELLASASLSGARELSSIDAARVAAIELHIARYDRDIDKEEHNGVFATVPSDPPPVGPMG